MLCSNLWRTNNAITKTSELHCANVTLNVINIFNITTDYTTNNIWNGTLAQLAIHFILSMQFKSDDYQLLVVKKDQLYLSCLSSLHAISIIHDATLYWSLLPCFWHNTFGYHHECSIPQCGKTIHKSGKRKNKKRAHVWRESRRCEVKMGVTIEADLRGRDDPDNTKAAQAVWVLSLRSSREATHTALPRDHSLRLWLITLCNAAWWITLRLFARLFTFHQAQPLQIQHSVYVFSWSSGNQ